MLGTVEILYKNFNDNLFNIVCDRLGINKEEAFEDSAKTTWVNPDPECAIKKIHCYSVFYNIGNWGRIWWVVITVDLRQLFQTEGYAPVPANRIGELEEKIETLLTENLQIDFRSYLPDILGDDILDKRISYLEYMIYIKNDNVDQLMKRLDRAYFDEKQLDPGYYDRYWIRNATPAFTINKIGEDTIRLCIKCKETAIKAMYKKDSEPYVGVANSIIFNKENVVDIFCKQIRKYTKPIIFEELSKEEIERNI